jgi:hypothetical protein
MTARAIFAIAGMLMASAGAAIAQDAMTVASLIKQDFAIVGTVASPAGPGLFLQKKEQLFLCFVVETPQSSTVTTRYCKPVQ